LEETLGWANSLVELTNEVDLDDVSGKGTEVSAGVVRVDLNALVLSLDLTGVDVLEANLLGNEVAGPDSDSVVVDGDELVVGAVEEFNLVGDIHTDIMAADGFTGLNIPNGERVVILTSEGGEVLLVLGERETLNEYLVQFEAFQRLQSVEVPDDDVRLEAGVGFLTTCDVLSRV